MNSTTLISRLESLSPEEKTPELTELEVELRSHGKYFNELMMQIANTGVITEEIKREREERRKVMCQVAEKVLAILYPLETLFHLKKSYETQVSRYRSLGWLVQRDGKEGIIGLDKNFYALPSLDKVQETLSEQTELLTYKHYQGFKKFMLVPFGMSYIDMYFRLATQQKRYAEDKDGTLGRLYRMDSARTKLTEIAKVPYVSDAMEKEAELLYYPETLYSNDQKVHQAKSKVELITDSATRFPGWELHLIPENPLLAREGKGKIIGDRPVFEAKKHFGDYLDIMKGREGTMDKDLKPVKDGEGQNIYRGEVGLIPEVWAAWALEELYSNNQVLHDYASNPKDSIAILMGTLIKEKSVAVSYFDKDRDRVLLRASDTVSRNGDYAGASSVKVC